MAQLPDSLEPVTDPERIAELRGATELHKDSGIGDRALGMILAATGDVGLAADAIAMNPRPEWVAEMLGPSAGMVGAEG